MSNWPGAFGPEGTGIVRSRAPRRWSVAAGRGVRWQVPMPEAGQSGIAVWGDRLFLTTMRPLNSTADRKDGGDVQAHCHDRRTGRLLWSVDLPAREESPYAYGFSDSSSPTPVTDGRFVWFVNASGHAVCTDFAGKVVWRRTWVPTTGRPFNKQCEPLLSDGVLVHVEPRDPGDFLRERDPWNYLRGIDSRTGRPLWVSEDALTHYNTPMAGRLPDGRRAVLIGRGGYHEVPEEPVGLTMTSLEHGDAGRAIWRYRGTGKALNNMRWDSRYAYWIDQDTPAHTLLDVRTGKVLRTDPLDVATVWRHREGERMVVERGVRFKDRGITVFPAWFTNTVVRGWHWFLCFSNPEPAYGIGPCGPLYCVARVHVETGRTEFLELPTHPDGRYRSPVSAGTKNVRDIDIASDPRSRRDGWHWVFLAPPVVAGGCIYWTLQNGLTYVLDSTVRELDEGALLGFNDAGSLGETWSLGGAAVADGCIFLRTQRALACIGS